ncbi:MAG: hypothetical protein PHR25_06990 [Clostridia bacterium]|nr:hypothetical protein [Clostridia bacterium]
MVKDMVAVYLKINSNNKKEMKEQVKIAKDFCKNIGLKIKVMIKDYKDDNNIEDLMAYCGDKSNNVYNLLTNDLSMISSDIYELYDRYVYLRDYCFCNLSSIKDGFDFDFEIKLIRGTWQE